MRLLRTSCGLNERCCSLGAMPMGGELGIRAHEWWAYFKGTTHPAEKVLIIDPGRHYYSSIRVRYEGTSTFHEFETTRSHLPCKWEDLDEYLEAHPERPRQGEVATTAEPVHIVHTTNELRHIIHEEVANALTVTKFAYTYPEAAIAVGVSTELLRQAVSRGDLIVRYISTKPVFAAGDLRRWVESLPEEPRRYR